MSARHAMAWILAVACLSGAEEFWNTAQPSQWSEQDIKTLATNSPWAQPAAVTLHGQPAVSEILIRWDSAAPVREACSVGGMERYLFSCTSKLLYLSGLSAKFDAMAKEFYIIGVSNYPKPPVQNPAAEPPQHSPEANALLQKLGDRLQTTTLLKRKGRPDLIAEHVIVLPAGQQLLLIFFFPRAAAFAATEGEVSFELTDGPLEAKARFELGRMIYQGRLEL